MKNLYKFWLDHEYGKVDRYGYFTDGDDLRAYVKNTYPEYKAYGFQRV